MYVDFGFSYKQNHATLKLAFLIYFADHYGLKAHPSLKPSLVSCSLAIGCGATKQCAMVPVCFPLPPLLSAPQQVQRQSAPRVAPAQPTPLLQLHPTAELWVEGPSQSPHAAPRRGVAQTGAESSTAFCTFSSEWILGLTGTVLLSWFLELSGNYAGAQRPSVFNSVSLCKN